MAIELVHVAITMTSRIFVSVKNEDRSIAAMAVSNNKSYSQYFQQLDSTARARYEEKLQILGDIEDATSTAISLPIQALTRTMSSRLTRAWMDTSMLRTAGSKKSKLRPYRLAQVPF